jgi:hypothetical protein
VPQTIEKQENATKTQQSNTKSSVKDDENNWVKYTDAETGISFEYPTYGYLSEVKKLPYFPDGGEPDAIPTNYFYSIHYAEKDNQQIWSIAYYIYVDDAFRYGENVSSLEEWIDYGMCGGFIKDGVYATSTLTSGAYLLKMIRPSERYLAEGGCNGSEINHYLMMPSKLVFTVNKNPQFTLESKLHFILESNKEENIQRFYESIKEI